MSNYADRLEFFSVVSAIHHERISEALNDWALGFSEALDGISASRVRDVDGASDLNVVAARCQSSIYLFEAI
jgi:hypothetical protein